jgi:hypothetical protein
MLKIVSWVLIGSLLTLILASILWAWSNLKDWAERERDKEVQKRLKQLEDKVQIEKERRNGTSN